jgi:hypothetical protein
MTGWGPKPVVLWSSTRFPSQKPDICALRNITSTRPPRPDPHALGQARADLGIVATRANAGGVQAVQWSLPG